LGANKRSQATRTHSPESLTFKVEFTLYFVYGAFETVPLNYKILRTTENEPCANSIHLGSKLRWVDFINVLIYLYNMETTISKSQKTIVIDLANAIASFNPLKVSELLSDNGEFNIKDEKGETVNADKIKFIKWLSTCFDYFLSANPDRKELRYTTDQCLHCKIGNPVIIFENGRFPLSTKEQWDREKCGLMLEFDGNLISDITFCYLFLKTDNPFIFERYCTKHPE